jgi:hypothetical protein
VLSYSGDIGLSFPPADAVVRDHLVESTRRKDAPAVQLRYYTFLWCLFKHVGAELQALYNEKDRVVTQTALAASWRQHLESPGVREALYQSVVQSACQTPQVCLSLCVSACANRWHYLDS